MLGQEKKELLLLLQYRVCKLYVLTNANTSVLSRLIGMPQSSVKRAINILDTEFDRCLELLPKAQDAAIELELICQRDNFSTKSLLDLKNAAEEARESHEKVRKIEDLDEYVSDELSLYIFDTRNLQKMNDVRLKIPATLSENIKELREEGYSISQIGEKYGLGKSTVKYNSDKEVSRRR